MARRLVKDGLVRGNTPSIVQIDDQVSIYVSPPDFSATEGLVIVAFRAGIMLAVSAMSAISRVAPTNTAGSAGEIPQS